jgi:hypothetical protein
LIERHSRTLYVTLRPGRGDYGSERHLRTRRIELLRRTFEELRDQVDLISDGAAERQTSSSLWLTARMRALVRRVRHIGNQSSSP